MLARILVALATLITPTMATPVLAQDVLVVGGGQDDWRDHVADVLLDHDIDAVAGPSFWELDGTTDFDAFDAVVILGTDWTMDMPAAGQEDLHEYVRAGGGLVTAAFLAYTVVGAEDTPLAELLPADFAGADDLSTIMYIEVEADPVLNDGVPDEIDFAAEGFNGSNTESDLVRKSGATTYYNGSSGAGLVGWRHGIGRVIMFDTLMSNASLASSDYRRLVVNAVRWSMLGSASGDEAGGRFGHSVAHLGNIASTNDFAIGAPFEHGRGAVHIFRGDDPRINEDLVYGQVGDRFGWAITGLDDVNGSGYDDFAISAPWHDGNGMNAGVVYVIEGENWSIIREHHGQRAGDRFGHSLDGGLDVNGDGIGDLLVGAPRFDVGDKRNAGRAYVFDGATGQRLHRVNGANARDMFGWAVAQMPDLDGDGRAESLVAAPKHDTAGSNAGRVSIHASDGALLDVLDGPRAGAQFGLALAALTDVDGDAIADLVVGSPKFDTASKNNVGRIDVYSGGSRTLIWKLRGGAEGQNLGFSVANAGDVTGDAVDDVVAGAPAYASGRGRIFVRDGADGSGVARLTGEEIGDRMGHAVTGKLIPWDEEPAVLIGAPRVDRAGLVDNGYAYLVSFEGGTAFASAIGGGVFKGAVDVAGDRACHADLDDDGHVDGADVVMLLSAWGTSGGDADLTGDGPVDAADVLAVLTALGSCEPQP